MDIDLRNNIYEQGNRIYGVIKEIDQVSHSNYPDSQKLEKINHIRDELNRIYEQSIALPEFLAQTKNKNQEGYEVIPRILTFQVSYIIWVIKYTSDNIMCMVK